MHGKVKNIYTVLIRKPQDRRPLGTPRHRWKDSIEMDLNGIVYEGEDWAQMSYS
jgi:hypothetical protein